MTKVRLEHSVRSLRNVHDESLCNGRPCPIHNKTNHVMRSFRQHWRYDKKFMERICPHEIGHPDPDDPFAEPTHGCDGCCSEDDGHNLPKRFRDIAQAE